MLWFNTCLCTKSQWWWLRFTSVRWWTRLIYWMEKAKHSTTEGLLSGLSGRNLSWILAVVSQWLRTNARTAVWSNTLVWLEKQWKVIRAIESRLETPPCAVNNKARQWGNRRLQLSGELEDTGYGRLAWKTWWGVMLNSTRYLTTRVKRGLWRSGERSSLHAGDPRTQKFS